MHTENGLKETNINPVLQDGTPAATILAALYVVPGAPMDAKGNVRVCNTSGGDQSFSIGWSTSTQPTVTYWEYLTKIGAGCSLDLFEGDRWFPATTTIWIYSDGGTVSFTYQGYEIASQTATPNFTGS